MTFLYTVFSLFSPMLLHLVISEIVWQIGYRLQGWQIDSALWTAAAALIVLPIAVCMYRSDTGRGYHAWEIPFFEGLKTKRTALLKGLILGVCANFIWSGVLSVVSVQEYFSNAVQEQLLASQAAVQIIGLGFLVPAVEELLFRGLIFNRMKQRMSVRMAILFSSLVFAVYHGNPIQIIFAFPLALLMAWLYEKERWLGMPAAFHIGVNLSTVLIGLL